MKSKIASQHQEMLSLFANFEESLRRKSSQRYSDIEFEFQNYAWKEFDAKTVIELLLSRKEYYEAHKKILFGGLCAWLVCPGIQDIIKMKMVLEGID